MKILDIRPAPPGVGRTVAHFDVQLTPDCRLYGLRLVEAEGGRHLTYAPNSHGVRVATFTRELACPGPGHSRRDRSLAVTFNPDGSFVAYSFANDDFRECRDHVKAALGLSGNRPTATPAAPPSNYAGLVDEGRRIDNAARLWAETVPLPGTLAETYLRGRGLSYDGEELRFHHGQRMMVAMMTDAVTGEPRGVHRTFLDAEGRKADRRMLGRAKGAVVRLSADDDVTNGLAVAEGIETALAVPFRPVWACLSAGTMRDFRFFPASWL